MSEHDTDRQLTEDAAGELRQRLRGQGWRSDLGWTTVGTSSVGAAAEGEARRTIAYLASVRAVDGGAPRVWKEGDVPVPPEADAREVFIARVDDTDWHSELLEAPAETIAGSEDLNDDEAQSSTPETV